jgi:DNA-binding MarR family transcriptional regulator
MADPDDEPLLGTLLRVPYSYLGDAVERGLVEAGHEGITRSHLTVIQPLLRRPEGARPTDLAAWAHIAKPSMAYLVRYLEERGYVERTPDPADGRAQHVRLTERGLAAARTVRQVVRDTEANWARHIGAGRLDELRSILRDLSTVIRPENAPW